MKIIIKEGGKDDSVRKTFECTDCGCIFTSDRYDWSHTYNPKYAFCCTCPWCRSERAFEKEDVQPVKYGRWLKRMSTPDSLKCSVCGNNHERPTTECPNCGAIMDLKE